jgi:hypothetical protein
MTTSGSVNFEMTRNELIKYAYVYANGIDADDTPNNTLIEIANFTLNTIVKRLSAKYPIWGYIDYTIPLYDQKRSYTIGPSGNKNIDRPLKITQVRRVVQGSDIENPIWAVSRQEYMEQPNKDSESPVNMVYYDPQLVKGVLYVWGVGTTDSVSLTDGSTDQWTDSPTTSGEYYYTGSDISAEPTYVFVDGTEQTEGTLGSLASGEYAWGDQDSLGTDTLYVYQTSDPDSQESGWIKVLTSQPDKVIITCHRPLEDFDDADNTPDFPQESYQMLLFTLAASLSIFHDKTRTQWLKGEARELMGDYYMSDTEFANLSVGPR